MGGTEHRGEKEKNIKTRRWGEGWDGCQRQSDAFLWLASCLWHGDAWRRHTLVCWSSQAWHKTKGAIRFIRRSVSPATVTHPSPPTFVILRRKSTEFRWGGFHLRMSSHLPALYFCRDTQSPTKWALRKIYTQQSCGSAVHFSQLISLLTWWLGNSGAAHHF